MNSRVACLWGQPVARRNLEFRARTHAAQGEDILSDALELMQAILGPRHDAASARSVLETALVAEADPMRYACARFAIDPADGMARAAAWADLVYSDTVPELPVAAAPSALRLDNLHAIRMVRLMVTDREVAFASPDFFGLINLRRARLAKPALRRRLCLVPAAAMRHYLATIASPALLDAARQNLTRHWPHAVAQLELTKPARHAFAALMALLVLLLLLLPYLGADWLMPFWVGIVLLPALIRLAALLTPPPPPEPPLLPADLVDLPVYSVLVPLRDEANMVDQLCQSLSRLDYPADRLDIVFVVEQRSPQTVAAVRRWLDDGRFSLVEVPFAEPLTKPKALDFALPLCRGQYVVVYDAEDRPEPSQLRRVAAHFSARPDVHCIQARLIIGNGGRGFLPGLFAGEYAGLFAVVLPALSRWNVVMPLGGTSNHFRLDSLRSIGGWDAFNVTEDADLGVRLARRGMATATSSAATVEDAPERLPVWLGQRTRWMKGWMQTIVVHNRRPTHLWRDLGWWRFLAFEVIVFGMIMAPLLHTGFVLSLILFLAMDGIALPFYDPWSIACVTVLVIGHSVAILTNILGLRRTGQTGLIPMQFMLPVYWLLIAWATLRAFADLAVRPFHWIKTPHDVTRQESKSERAKAKAKRHLFSGA